MPPEMPPGELKKLLEENLSVTKDTNRLIRLMRRDAWIGMILKAVIWLVLLGVPLFFLSTYLAPLLSSLTALPGAGQGTPGPFGLPSGDQLNQLIEEYRAVYQ